MSLRRSGGSRRAFGGLKSLAGSNRWASWYRSCIGTSRRGRLLARDRGDQVADGVADAGADGAEVAAACSASGAARNRRTGCATTQRSSYPVGGGEREGGGSSVACSGCDRARLDSGPVRTLPWCCCAVDRAG